MTRTVKYILNLLFILHVTVLVSGCYFTSTVRLEKLLLTQNLITSKLEDYVNKEEKRLNTIKRYLEIFKTETDRSMNDIEHYVRHPLNGFTLLKRLTIDLKLIKETIQNCTDVKPYYDLSKEQVSFPDYEDVVGAAHKIAEIQKVYNLKTSVLADGKVKNLVPTATPMKANDCYELGNALISAYEYDFALLWLKEALRRYREERSEEYYFTEFDIIHKIEQSYAKIDLAPSKGEFPGSAVKAYEWARKLLRLKPRSNKIAERINLYRKKLQSNVFEDIKSKSWNLLDDVVKNFVNRSRRGLKKVVNKAIDQKLRRFRRLCSMDADILGDNSERLVCRYLFENNPFLRIAPIKMEYKNYDPLIVLFREVLSELEMHVLKRIALNQFRPFGDHKQDVNSSKVGYGAWLNYEDFETVRKLLARVEDMTGMDQLSSEQMMVFNYGIGGTYLPHYDYFTEKNKPKRLASVLFYLSDVELGGATVFTRLGVSVRPARGTALFWMNCHVNGEINVAMRHGACPVGFGSKWIVNQWISKYGQEFVIPCKMEKLSDGTLKKLYRFNGRGSSSFTYF